MLEVLTEVKCRENLKQSKLPFELTLRLTGKIDKPHSALVHVAVPALAGAAIAA
jgi:hypothetical protein